MRCYLCTHQAVRFIAGHATCGRVHAVHAVGKARPVKPGPTRLARLDADRQPVAPGTRGARLVVRRG